MDDASDRQAFPRLTFDAVRVGMTIESAETLVRPDVIATFAYAVDDHNPWFFEDSPYGGAIGHPTLLANQALLMRENHFTVGPALHTKWEMETLAPIRPGMWVRSRGTVVDKYERRGQHYMVTEFVTQDRDGTVLARGSFTQLIFPVEASE